MKQLNDGIKPLSYSGKGEPVGASEKATKKPKKLSGGKKHAVQKL